MTPTDIDRELNTSAQLITGRTIAALASRLRCREGDSGCGDVSVAVSAAAVEDTNAIADRRDEHNAELAAVTANAYAKRSSTTSRTRPSNQLQRCRRRDRQAMDSGPTPLEQQDRGVRAARPDASGHPCARAHAETANYTIAEPAVPADAPYTPKPVRDAILALVIGLVGGIAIAFLAEQLDVRVHTGQKSLSEALSAAGPGALPRPTREEEQEPRPGASPADPTGPSAEAFRMLRGNLEFVDVDGDVHSILWSRARRQGEGKTTTAGNLAVMLARAGKRSRRRRLRPAPAAPAPLTSARTTRRRLSSAGSPDTVALADALCSVAVPDPARTSSGVDKRRRDRECDRADRRPACRRTPARSSPLQRLPRPRGRWPPTATCCWSTVRRSWPWATPPPWRAR